MPTFPQPGFRKAAYAYASGSRPRTSDGRGLARTLLAVGFLLALSLLILIIGAATAQGQTQGDFINYTAAVAQPDRPTRLHALDAYVRSAPPGPYRLEGMTYLAWEYLQAGERERTAQWAQQLLLADPENAFALGLVADNARRAAQLDKHSAQQILDETKRGMTSLPRLQRPLGMPEAEFERVRQLSQALLKGAAGEAELYRKNYPAARNDLRDALAISPDNPRDTYALARAYLDGKDADPQQGYWYLARAVNLTQGTPDGAQIAQYARDRYVKEGGSDAAWTQFLAAARVPGRPTTATQVARAEPAPSVPSQTVRPPQPQPVEPSGTITAAQTPTKQGTAAKPPAPSEAARPDAEANIWADLTPPSVTGPKRLPVASTGPVSLGILIEASLTGKQNRNALTNSLIDMVRRLGNEDEAFILGYSDNLIFEEDLTADPNQLESAIEGIKPQQGAALDDAVAFAAGHLARIAKNPRRELLVISDGRNVDSQISTGRTLAAINAAGVRIYCIGMDVNQLDSRYRLQTLSSSTGGHSKFISDPQQLRQATMELARNMGINFRY